MPIESIARLTPITPSISPDEAGATGQPQTAFNDFSQILGTAISVLNQQEQTANQAAASLAAGEDIELHQVMLAMQKADISFQIALDVRNKIIEAYQEVMRLQV